MRDPAAAAGWASHCVLAAALPAPCRSLSGGCLSIAKGLQWAFRMSFVQCSECRMVEWCLVAVFACCEDHICEAEGTQLHYLGSPSTLATLSILSLDDSMLNNPADQQKAARLSECAGAHAARCGPSRLLCPCPRVLQQDMLECIQSAAPHTTKHRLQHHTNRPVLQTSPGRQQGMDA